MTVVARTVAVVVNLAVAEAGRGITVEQRVRVCGGGGGGVEEAYIAAGLAAGLVRVVPCLVPWFRPLRPVPRALVLQL